MSWFSFDAMGEFAFGKDFGMMDSRRWHPTLVRQQKALAILAPIADTVWLIRAVLDIVPFVGLVQDYMQMVHFCDDHMKKRMQVSCSKETYQRLLIEAVECRQT